MRTRKGLVALLAVGMLAGPMAAHAAIVFSLDDANNLQGTFSIAGALERRTPTVFDLLPSNSITSDVFGSRGQPLMGFGSEGVGYPDNPYFLLVGSSGPVTFGPFIGSYTNSNQSGEGGTPVYWRYFNWRDSGGAAGVFSGDFCFSTTEANCAANTPPVPLPAAAWLLLSGLGGLGLLRKRKAA